MKERQKILILEKKKEQYYEKSEQDRKTPIENVPHKNVDGQRHTNN